MLEDWVQEIYWYIRGDSRRASRSRVVGYVWVLAFLSWSTAAWQYPVLLIGKGACRFQVECFSFAGFAGESMSLQEGPGERLSPASCIYKAFGSWLNSNNKPAFSIRVSRFAHIMHTNYTTRVRSGRRKHGCESLGFVSALKRSTLQQIVLIQ